MSSYDDFMKTGLDFQKDFMRQYKQNMDAASKLYGMGDFMNAFTGASSDQKQSDDAKGDAKNPAEQWFEAAKAYVPGADAYDAYAKMMQSAFGGMQQQFGQFPDFMKAWGVNTGSNPFQAPSMFDVMGKLSDSAKIYNDVYAYWAELAEDLPLDTPEKIKKYADKYQQLSASYMQTMMNALAPNGLGALSGSYNNLFKNMSSAGESFVYPWMMDQSKMSDLVQKMMGGDSSAYSEYVRLISDAYKQTYGKLFNLVGIGASHDDVELEFQTLDAYLHMCFTFAELTALVNKISKETSDELLKTYTDALTGGDGPADFKAFYDVWHKTNENAFESFFASEEFKKIFNEFASDSSKFKIKLDEMLEKLLGQLPIPTNAEMKGLYKTVYDLRKEVDKLRKEVTGLKKAAEPAKPAK